MRNYQSSEPSGNYMKLDKSLIHDMSESAFVLLITLTLLKANEDNSNEALMKLTGFGERKFLRSKNELIDKGYLDTRQVYANKYVLYIGKESVRRCRASKYKKENRHEAMQIKQIKESLDADKV